MKGIPKVVLIYKRQNMNSLVLILVIGAFSVRKYDQNFSDVVFYRFMLYFASEFWNTGIKQYCMFINWYIHSCIYLFDVSFLELSVYCAIKLALTSSGSSAKSLIMLENARISLLSIILLFLFTGGNMGLRSRGFLLLLNLAYVAAQFGKFFLCH